MSSDSVIKVQGVSKAYRIWQDPGARLMAPAINSLARLFPKDSRPHRSLLGRAERYYRDFYALRDISFEVGRGESVGIIGRNGSGKSTLLQIIAGTLSPTSGSVEVDGRVAALLELGSGFNPEFTGRENVFLNGAVLGLTRKEVEERFEAITAFADIGEFIDQPVKTYSSGMQVRLAFAVSINVAADIIIVDEALSVGDVNFQAKCIAALRQLQLRGTTFLIVTHGADVVKSMCQRGVYLKGGRLEASGPAPVVADLYAREMREELSAELMRSYLPNSLPTGEAAALASTTGDRPKFRRDHDLEARIANGRSGTNEAEITAVDLLDETGSPSSRFGFGAKATVRIHLELKQDLEFLVGYHIRDNHNLTLLCTGTFTELGKVLRGAAGDRLIVDFETALPLRQGRYNIAALISTKYLVNRTAQFVDWVEPVVVFEMLPREPQVIWGAVYFPNKVRLWHAES
jgi:lipopolysaccharide transport system ATP-binding protein